MSPGGITVEYEYTDVAINVNVSALKVWTGILDVYFTSFLKTDKTYILFILYNTILRVYYKFMILVLYISTTSVRPYMLICKHFIAGSYDSILTNFTRVGIENIPSFVHMIVKNVGDEKLDYDYDCKIFRVWKTSKEAISRAGPTLNTLHQLVQI